MLGTPCIAAADVLVVDRGLPTANLNNIAGSNRSNVAWADGDVPNFYGDDFTLGGAPGTVYAIDTIRTWVVSSATDPAALAAIFPTITLFTGIGNTLTATATGPSVSHVQYAGGLDYQTTGGSSINIFEVDFTGLSIVATAGTTVAFGVEGTGTGGFWFNHASNAALSGSPQDSANNSINFYTWTGSGDPVFDSTFDSNGHGWDKSSDINVQVLANVPEPASMTLLGAGALALGVLRRRKKSTKQG